MTIFKRADKAVLRRVDHVGSRRENLSVLFEAVGDVCDLRQRAVGDSAQRTDIAVNQASGGLEHLRCTVGVFNEARGRVDKATIDIGEIARCSVDQLAQFAVGGCKTIDQFADIVGKTGLGLLNSGNRFRCAACKRIDQSGVFRTKPVCCGMGCFFKLLRQSTTAISKPLYKRFCRIVEDLGDFLRTGSENGIELTSTFF